MESQRSLPLQKGLPLCLSPANNFKSALSYSSHQFRFGRPNNILWSAHKSCVQLIAPCNQYSISHHQNTTFRQVCLRYKVRQAAFWIRTYRVSQKERTKLRESVPYVELYRYNPKHLYPKLNGYGDNGQRSLKFWQLLHTYWLSNTY